MEYLGYILSPAGLTMAEDKVKIIIDWPTPLKVKDVQSFLGFANFYRRFIPAYSNITVPLTRLTRKNAPWNWSEECQKAFDALKKAFTSAPVLAQWVPDVPIIVETDASDYALADHHHLPLPQPASGRECASDRALDLPGHEGGLSALLVAQQPLLLRWEGY